MKYYYREHTLGYQRVRAEGKTAWHEIHGRVGFDNFCSRAFLEAVLPGLRFSVPRPSVLECGCGTGPGACFLAQRGFQVEAIDIIPAAIELAKEQAEKRSVEVHYAVRDICELPHDGKQYDMIVDSYCLQGIVTDADRERVFAAVRARLKPDGYYLVSSAMFDEARLGEARVQDARTGIVYHVYGADGLIDMRTGIVLKGLDDEPAGHEDAIRIENTAYLPSRRHLKAAALKAELEGAGLSVLYQDSGLGGDLVCALRSAGRPSR